MNQPQSKNTITMTKGLILNFSAMSCIPFTVRNSTLITGVNGAGKSTMLDALSYLLVGNTNFNQAASDKDRSVLNYVRGNTNAEGGKKYIRNGEITSYIVAQFYNPSTDQQLVLGVCMESPDIKECKSYWFAKENATISDFNFYEVRDRKLFVVPKNQLCCKGERLSAKNDFSATRERGLEVGLRALGIRCKPSVLKDKISKLLSFKVQNDVSKFIRDYVLEKKEFSLDDIRECKAEYQELTDCVSKMENEKDILFDINSLASEYEKIEDDLQIKKLKFDYQEIYKKEKALEEETLKMKAYQAEYEQLQQNIANKEVERDRARDRATTARSSSEYMDIAPVIEKREGTRNDLIKKQQELEDAAARLLRVRQSILQLLNSKDYSIALSDRDIETLNNLNSESVSSTEKCDVVTKFEALVEKELENKRQQSATLNLEKNKLVSEIQDLERKKKKLEGNNLEFDERFESARRYIHEELRKSGINTDVRFLAELITEITKPEWQNAIESYLGNKRFDIIVDPEYCRAAIKALDENPAFKGCIIRTDSLPKRDVMPGSAASIVVSANPSAQNYINYLLNGIHLCDNLDEFNQYPNGAMLANGTLDKGFRVSKLDIRNIKRYIGKDAIADQLKQTVELLSVYRNQLNDINTSASTCIKNITELQEFIKNNATTCQFNAMTDLNNCKAEIMKINTEIDSYKNNQSFMAVFEEINAAEDALRFADNELKDLNSRAGDLTGRIFGLDGCEKKIAQLKKELAEKKNEFEEKTRDNLEMKNRAIEECEKEFARRGSAVAQSTIDDVRQKLEGHLKKLIERQTQYCVSVYNGSEVKTGQSYIPFYREEFKTLSNVKLEECKVKLSEKRRDLHNLFARDFIAGIYDNMLEAKREINELNRKLKNLPFGDDKYQFNMKERNDRESFFRIANAISEQYMDNVDAAMELDETLEHELEVFIDTILQEQDQEVYTDYRNYYNYDIDIMSHKDGDLIVTSFSQKNGSASNGEKQTPYYLILAASLMLCYPQNACCGRFVFIDEAYNALSDDRIKQLVKFFEDNNFQVFYAAPPQKIGPIGEHIDTTIVLSHSGVYTQLVECVHDFKEAKVKYGL